MKRRCFFLLVGLLVASADAESLSAELQQAIAGRQATDEHVSREQERQLLLSYYPRLFVEEVLQSHAIDEKMMVLIVDELQTQDERILSTVEEKLQKLHDASQGNGSPLFALREEEVAAMYDALQEVFTTTLAKHDIADRALSAQMFDEIQNKKASLFAKAIQRGR